MGETKRHYHIAIPRSFIVQDVTLCPICQYNLNTAELA